MPMVIGRTNTSYHGIKEYWSFFAHIYTVCCKKKSARGVGPDWHVEKFGYMLNILLKSSQYDK